MNGKKMKSLFSDGKKIYKNGPDCKIVDFATGTDEQISAMLDAHYRGEINIADYWKVGDTRLVHINATNSGTCNHVAQDMTMVIIGFNHDDLATPINGKDKAGISVQFREIMGKNDVAESEYYFGKETIPIGDESNYSSTTSLRSWLNGNLLNALPTTFRSLIKEVNKKNLARHSSTSGSPLITKDKIWLLSYPEVFGAEIYKNYLSGANPSDWEGTQYKFYENVENRKKYINNNGQKSQYAQFWWLRSPNSHRYTDNGYCFLSLDVSAKIYECNGYVVSGIAPAFCL